jgi:hypothetical protein
MEKTVSLGIIKNKLLVFFVFCSGFVFGQANQKTTRLNHSDIRLISESEVILDGNIISASSFDVIAYTNYHSRIANSLSPFLILTEPLPHNLLMAHKYVRLIQSGNSFAAQFSLNPPESKVDDDYSDLEKIHYSSLFHESNATATAENTTPKVKSVLGLLCIIAYQVASADHNWGGYSSSKE